MKSEAEANNTPSPAARCPHCDQSPLLLSIQGPLAVGPVAVMLIFCGNVACSKVFTVEVVGTTNAIVPPGRAGNGILYG